MLCDRCADLFRGWCSTQSASNSASLKLTVHKSDYVRQNKDTWDLERLKEPNGCFVCHRVWDTCRARVDVQSDPSWKFFIERTVQLQAPECLLGYLSILVWVEEPMFNLREYIDLPINPIQEDVLNKPDDISEPRSIRDVGSSTDSYSALWTASSWIQKCKNEHLACNRHAGRTRLPTRLLQLGQPRWDYVRVINSPQDDTRLQYMTLSHCWGSALFLKLTSATEKELFSGVPVSQLPRTFQDAAFVARNLGAEYIWIDSLCIYQDAIQDWHRESSTMSEVYKGSVCNIAATSSSNSDGGCFRQRDPRLLQPCIVTTEYTNCPNMTYILESHSFSSIPHETVQPLFNRAWIVQERVLAPRTLHFGSEYIFWECGKERASEIHPKGIIGKRRLIEDFHLTMDPAQHTSFEEAYQQWRVVVNTYSKCSLTFAKDKLVAISGIAKEMKILGSPKDYVAGLWRDTILLDMLWETSSGSRPTDYRAPTWSWASLDGPISYHDVIHSHFHREGYCKILVFVVDVSIQYMTLDPFAEVTGGRITISGRLATLHVESEGHVSRFVKTYINSYRFESSSIKSEETADGFARIKFDVGSSYIGGSNTPDIMGPSQRLHVLPVVRTLTVRKPLYFCLVLKPTLKGKGMFKRVGLLMLESKGEDPAWFDIEQKTAESHYQGTSKRDWLEYQEFDGEKYTITII